MAATGAELADSVQFGKRHNGEPGSQSDSMAKHGLRGIKASYATYEKNVAVCRGGSLEWRMATEEGGRYLLKVKVGVGIGRDAYISYLRRDEWVKLPAIESVKRSEGKTCVYDIDIPKGQTEATFRWTSIGRAIAYLFSAQLLKPQRQSQEDKLRNERISQSVEAARVSSGDGLSFSLSNDGHIRKVTLGGEDCTDYRALRKSGLTIVDVDSGEPMSLRGKVSRDQHGRVTYAATMPKEQLNVTLTYEAAGEHIRVRGEVESARASDRGVVVTYALPIAAIGWRWCGILERDAPIEKGRHYEESELFRSTESLRDGLQLKSEKRKRWYRLSHTFCSSLYSPQHGISLVQPRDEFRIFRTYYDAEAGLFQMEYALGLSPDTRPLNRATFSFIICRSAGEWGYRAALEKYYRIFPQFFENRIEKQGGTCPFTNPFVLKNCDEFMHRFAWSPSGATVLRNMGLYTFSYYAPTRVGCNIEGYGPKSGKEPTLEQKLDAIDRVYRGRRGYTPNAAPLSIPMDRQGQPMIHRSSYSDWSAPVSLDPDLPYGKFLLGMLKGRLIRAKASTSGIAYDGLTPGLNYRRAHFRCANHPLLYDSGAKSCTIYNFFACLEFMQELRGKLNEIDAYAIVNITPSRLLFAGPFLDVFTEECGVDPPYHTLAMHRMSAYQKPVTIIAKELWARRSPRDVEDMMRKCLYWGVFPGCFDGMPSIGHAWSNYWAHPEWYNRDRACWRKYLPLIQDVATAGWHPVPYARTDRGRVGVQRFGDFKDGAVYFTLRNRDVLSARVRLRIDRATLGIGDDVLAIDEIADSELDGVLEGGMVEIPVSLAGREIKLIGVSRRSAYQARRLNRAIQWLNTRRLYREQAKPYGDRLTAWNGDRVWRVGDYAIDRQVSHTGAQCVRMEAPKGTLCQARMFLDKKPQTLVLSAWSRSERVAESLKEYAIGLRIDYVGFSRRDCTSHAITFPAGTNEWQYRELKVAVDKPIETVEVRVKLEGKGKAWFDDLALGSEADGFTKNLLFDPGFEERFPTDDEQAALDAKMEDLRQALISLRQKPLATFGRAIEAKIKDTRDWIDRNSARDLAARELRDLADIERLLGQGGFFGGEVTLRMRADQCVYPGQRLEVRVVATNTTPDAVRLASPQLTASAPGWAFTPAEGAKSVELQPGQRREFGYCARVPASAKQGESIALAAEVREPKLARSATSKVCVNPAEVELLAPRQEGEAFVQQVRVRNNLSEEIQGHVELVLPQEATSRQLRESLPRLTPHDSRDVLFKIPTAAMKRGRYTVQCRLALTGKGLYEKQQALSFGNLTIDAKVVVDSCHGGYVTGPLNDGVVNMQGLGWRDAAWASRYAKTPPWVEIQLPKPCRIHRVVVFWAYDHGCFYPSRQYSIQCMTQGNWQTVVKVEANKEAVSDHRFPEVTAQRVRIWQPPTGGSPPKPTLMWVGEVEVY